MSTTAEERGRLGGMGAHHRATEGETNDWYTPPLVFDALGVRFDLDPAAPPGGVPWVPAERHYCEADDGLTQPWDGRVWLNPPYGPHTAAWLRKLAAHGDGIALVFARTDTAWFHETVPSADVVCFLEGRLTFVTAAGERAKHNAGAPSMLVAWGGPCAEAVAACGLGMVFTLRRRDLEGQGSLFEGRIEP